MKLGSETNSLMNWLMANGGSKKPEIGMGATEFHYTDRTAYTVIRVNKDRSEVFIRTCRAIRTDKNGMSDAQSYRYEEQPNCMPIRLVFKWGAYRRVVNNGDGTFRYPKINIAFGYRREYYDYSF